MRSGRSGGGVMSTAAVPARSRVGFWLMFRSARCGWKTVGTGSPRIAPRTSRPAAAPLGEALAAQLGVLDRLLGEVRPVFGRQLVGLDLGPGVPRPLVLLPQFVGRGQARLPEEVGVEVVEVGERPSGQSEQ